MRKKPAAAPNLLWRPTRERVADSVLARFLRFLEKRHELNFAGSAEEIYTALHLWSIDHLEDFWASFWDFSATKHTETYSSVLGNSDMPGARWFEDATLNFAENLLYSAQLDSETRTALIFESEDESRHRTISFRELRESVSRCAASLKALGVKKGDRVAALTPNVPEAVVAMLATTSIGAIWSSCSPDFGHQGILDRFGQIEPVVLFAADGYLYNGKSHGLGERLAKVLESLPSIQNVVVYPYAGPPVEGLRAQQSWTDFLAVADNDDTCRSFEPFPFAQPAFILYTSGTTGTPKCVVHSAGGTLLKHKKELMLQCDVRPGDVIFFFTTCGWMMWNWLVSGLACGATVVLYDGSPAHPDLGRIFRMTDRNRVNALGTSPRFLATVEKSGYSPRTEHGLESLRTIFTTGSPLHAGQFEWVYRELKEDLHLASISGGTDIIGCFVGGSPFLPVHSGEIQCSQLGMHIQSFDEQGKARIGYKGELICSTPFPSMPVGFWNDPGDERYRSAYFERYEGCWHHGDFVEITDRGSVIIYGRSDATLNPGGVRIGTAEIYRVVEQIEEVTDCVAAGVEEDGDVKILLYVVLRDDGKLCDELRDRIRKGIREQASPRHVPNEIHQIQEVPRTVSGKAVEIAVSKVLMGEDPGNREALANPNALDQFQRRRNRSDPP